MTSGVEEWWPVDDSEALTGLTDQITSDLGRQTTLDELSVQRCADLLAQRMAVEFPRIRHMDRLPAFCHVFNGWGNAAMPTGRILELLSGFLHRESGQARILQRDAEGDYHPWQTFAYMAMAGIPVTTVVHEGVTLAELARNSCEINTDDADEYGHLLYALAHMPWGPRATVETPTRTLPLAKLVAEAVEAHYYGGFHVCRKLHLTEGLCAITAAVPALEPIVPVTQAFVDGQMRMAVLLCGIFERIDSDAALAEAEVRTLRDALALDDFFENHAYLVGHLTELAGIARATGFRIATTAGNALVGLANAACVLTPEYLPFVSFSESFLHFGHLRRGTTMLVDLRGAGWPMAAERLARFTARFDIESAGRHDASRGNGPGEMPVRRFACAPAAPDCSPVLKQVVSAFEAVCPAELSPRGSHDHFRRVRLTGWPRALHYEFLVGDGGISFELHLERRELLNLVPTVAGLKDTFGASLGRAAEWDPDWYGGCGRLRAHFEADESAAPIAAAPIAAAALSAVAATAPVITAALRSLACEP